MSDRPSAAAADVSRSDIGWNMLQYAVPFAAAAILAIHVLGQISFDVRLFGAGLVRNRARTSRLLRPSFLERVAAWIFLLGSGVLLAPPLLLVAWGFYSYHSLLHLYGLNVALIGLALYCLLLALLRWRACGWQMVRSVRLLLLAALLLLFAFEIWMVALTTPYTFIGVSAVLLAFNMLPVAHLAFALTGPAPASSTARTEGGVSGDSDDDDLLSEEALALDAHKPFVERAVVQREMREAAARVGVTLIRVQQAEQRRSERRQATVQQSTLPTAVPVRASPSRAERQDAPMEERKEMSVMPVHAVADPLPRESGVGQRPPPASSPRSSPSSGLLRVFVVYLSSLLVLFAYALTVRYTVTDAPWLGFITLGAIGTLDLVLVLGAILPRPGRRVATSGAGALWLSILGRFILVFFGADLYFMGHCLVYFVGALLLVNEVLDELLPLRNERTTRDQLVKRLQAGILTTGEEEDAAEAGNTASTARGSGGAALNWVGAALFRLPLLRRASPQRQRWLMSLAPLLALLFLTLMFLLDLLLAAELVTVRIKLQREHEQWVAGVLTLLASLLLALARGMVRVYENNEYNVSTRLARMAGGTYALILCCGLCFHYLSVFSDFLAALLCVFLPPFVYLAAVLYFHWRLCDFTWFAPSRLRNPPHQTWWKALANGGVTRGDYGVIAGWIMGMALLVSFGVVASYTYSPWWLGFVLSGGLFVVLTTLLSLVQWFGTLTWCWTSIGLMFLSSLGAFIGGMVVFWVVVLEEQADVQAALPLLFVLLLYPSLVVLGAGFYKFVDDGWRVRAGTAAGSGGGGGGDILVPLALLLANVVVLGFFGLVAWYYDPWQGGASAAMMYSILILFKFGLPYVRRWSPRVARWVLGCALGSLGVFALSVGMVEGTGFVGFSIAWGGVGLMAVMAAWEVVDPATQGKEEVVLFYYAHTVLPVYRYKAGSGGAGAGDGEHGVGDGLDSGADSDGVGMGGGVGGAANPLSVYNRRVLLPFLPLVLLYLWSIPSVYFLDPPVVGLGLSSLALVGMLVYGVHVSRASEEEVREGAEFLGGEMRRDAANAAAVSEEERDASHDDSGHPDPSHATKSAELFRAMVARCADIAAQAQFVRGDGGPRLGVSKRAGGGGGGTGKSLAAPPSGSSSVQSVQSVAIDVATGVASPSAAATASSSSPSPSPASNVLSFIWSRSDADAFLESLQDEGGQQGAYTYPQAQADLGDLWARLPAPALGRVFGCGGRSIAVDDSNQQHRGSASRSRVAELASSSSSLPPSTTPPPPSSAAAPAGAVLRWKRRWLSRVGAYWLLGALSELGQTLYASQEMFEVQTKLEVLLQVRQIKESKIKLVARAMEQIKATTATTSRATGRGTSPNDRTTTSVVAAASANVFDLRSSLSLQALLRSPERLRQLESVLHSLHRAQTQSAHLKRRKRAEELRAQNRRALLAEGGNTEGRRGERRRDTANQGGGGGGGGGGPPRPPGGGGRGSGGRGSGGGTGGWVGGGPSSGKIVAAHRSPLSSSSPPTAAADGMSDSSPYDWTTSPSAQATFAAKVLSMRRADAIDLREEGAREASELVLAERLRSLAGEVEANNTQVAQLQALIAQAGGSQQPDASDSDNAAAAAPSQAQLHARLAQLLHHRASFVPRAAELERAKAAAWQARQDVRRGIEATLRELDPFVQRGQCTFAAATGGGGGTELKFQRWFTCEEQGCPFGGAEEARGFCESCRVHCHPASHPLRTHFSRFYCHCGWAESVRPTPPSNSHSHPSKQKRRLGGCRVLHGPPAGAAVNIDDGGQGGSACDVVVRLHPDTSDEAAAAELASPSAKSVSSSPPASSQLMLSDLSIPAQLSSLVRQCKDRGEKWSDPDFPPSDHALYIEPGSGSTGASATTHAEWQSLRWYRASEFMSSPALFVPPFAPDVIKQGMLGDCYLMSALAVLTLRPHLLRSLFVGGGGGGDEEDVDGELMARAQAQGIYAVRFWKNGRVRTVMVDDWLPCIQQQQQQQDQPSSSAGAPSPSPSPAVVSAFGRSLTPNELWVALVEKAYAKLHRSYESIEAGCVDVGLVDLTGGVGDRVDLTSSASLHAARNGALWSDLLSWFESGYLLGAGSPAGREHEDASSSSSRFGIVQGHAYSILRVVSTDGHCLLRMRNPWAYEAWSGAWSDGDEVNWTQRMRRRLNHEPGGGGAGSDSRGAFWISFSDFLRHFDDLYICRFFDRSHWLYAREVRGEWQGLTAGGGTNFYSVVHSPQYALVLRVPCDVVITLAQYDARADRQSTQKQGTGEGPLGSDDTDASPPGPSASALSRQFAIGVEVYDNMGARVSRRRRGKLVASNPSGFAFRREVTAQFRLPLLPGDRPYTVLVATLEPKQETTFIMQIYATQPIEFNEMPQV